jgi:cell fate (sporulation/competence/biofilm development) regulator YlbF (YheA/YmcA/DUF963 family)
MGKPSTHKRKGNKEMTTKEKAVKEAVKENQAIKNEYTELIASGVDSNSQAIQFVQMVAKEMQAGTTIREVKASMQSLLKDINIKPVILPTHAESIPVANLIIAKYSNEIEGIKVSKILSLSARVLADKKAGGAKSHIEGIKSFEELDTKTATKKESQTRDGSTKPKAEKKAKPVNVEDLVSAIYQGITSMKPIGQLTEKGKKEAKVIEGWIMQLQNNQIKAKVNA